MTALHRPTTDPPPDPPPLIRTVTCTVVAPHQVYWAQVAYTDGETVTLPVALADRFTAAGWVVRTAATKVTLK